MNRLTGQRSWHLLVIQHHTGLLGQVCGHQVHRVIEIRLARRLRSLEIGGDNKSNPMSSRHQLTSNDTDKGRGTHLEERVDLVDDAFDGRWCSGDLVARSRLICILHRKKNSDQNREPSQFYSEQTISTHLKSDVHSDSLDHWIRVVQNLLGVLLDRFQSLHASLRILQMLLRRAIGLFPGLELLLLLLVLELLFRVCFLFQFRFFVSASRLRSLQRGVFRLLSRHALLLILQSLRNWRNEYGTPRHRCKQTYKGLNE